MGKENYSLVATRRRGSWVGMAYDGDRVVKTTRGFPTPSQAMEAIAAWLAEQP